jgi:hypothetical protein
MPGRRFCRWDEHAAKGREAPERRDEGRCEGLRHRGLDARGPSGLEGSDASPNRMRRDRNIQALVPHRRLKGRGQPRHAGRLWPRCRTARWTEGGLSLACALALAAIPLRLAAGPSPEVSVSANWDSCYVSEGHDNLDGQDLVSTTAAVSWPNGGLSVWYGTASGGYQELNLSAGAQFDLGPVQLGLGYTRLEFRVEGVRSADNELSATFAVPLPSSFDAEFSAVYSTEAEGSFVTARAWRTWELEGGAVHVTAFVAGALDFGYVSATFDGANHLEAGLEVEVRLSRQVSAATYVAHALALANLERSGFEDITWGGLRLTAAF